MAAGIFYPAASGDDGRRHGTSLDTISGNLQFGLYGGVNFHSFMRFVNVIIPQSATITSAFIRFTCATTNSNTDVLLNIYLNDIDNAVAPTTPGEFDGLDLTSLIAWDNLPTWTLDSTYDSIDIASIVQSVINRAGWSSGNALQVLIKDDGSTNFADRRSYSYDSGSNYAELHVEWILTRISADIPAIEPLLLGGGLLAPTIPAIEPFLGGAGLLAPTFPTITPIMEGSDDLNHGNLILSLPMLSALITKTDAGTLTATIPAITAAINESVDRGNVSATLPLITAEVIGGIGSFLEVDLPLITPDIVSGVLLNVDIPMMTISAEGVCGEVGELEITLPTITVSTTGKVEILGSIDTLLPILQAYVKGLTGKLIAGDVTLPAVQADIAGYNDLTGDIDSTVAMLTAYMTGTPTRFAACSYILRYDDLPDCLGSILTELPIIAVSIED